MYFKRGKRFLRAFPIRNEENGGAVTSTVSMPRRRTTRLAARSANGYHKTSGSGERIRRIARVARDFRPPLLLEGAAGEEGAAAAFCSGPVFFFWDSQFQTV